MNMLNKISAFGAVKAKSLAVVLGVFISISPSVTAQDNECSGELLSEPIYWDINHLESVKSKLNDDGFTAKAAYDDLIKQADEALTTRPYTVTDKERAGASGNVKDYVSLSRYFWPDPKSKDGLPYIRKDGYTNPEIDGVNFDRRRSQHMTDAVFQKGARLR